MVSLKRQLIAAKCLLLAFPVLEAAGLWQQVLLGFESQLSHSLLVQLQVHGLTLLSLCFLLCKMDTFMPPALQASEVSSVMKNLHGPWGQKYWGFELWYFHRLILLLWAS